MICSAFTLASLLGAAVNMAHGGELRLIAPTVFYGCSLASLLYPQYRLFSLFAICLGVVFVAVGIYGMVVVAGSARYAPWQPLLFVIVPAVFVSAAVARERFGMVSNHSIKVTAP